MFYYQNGLRGDDDLTSNATPAALNVNSGASVKSLMVSSSGKSDVFNSQTLEGRIKSECVQDGDEVAATHGLAESQLKCLLDKAEERFVICVLLYML